MKKTLLLLFIACSILQAQEKNELALKYASSIQEKALQKNLNILASDEFEGRETGEKGQKAAAILIAEQFKKAGIPPCIGESYYQSFGLRNISPKPAFVKIGGKKYKNLVDFYTYPPDGNRQLIDREILFLGYGIQENDFDDYKNKEVKNKIIMILTGEPMLNDSISLITNDKSLSKWSGHYRTKYNLAEENGVAALLIIVDDLKEDILNYRHRIERKSMQLDPKQKQMPVLFISKQMANKILGDHTQLDELINEISENKKPTHIEIQTEVLINIKNRLKRVDSENVLGYVEGGDLKDELIIITAHYDHLGKRGKKIFNGADDDGSGTVAVIAMAEAFAKAKKEGHGPRRSILFMTVSGEEKGLLGSSYYVENPVFPLENTVCDLNIDMIGRIDKKHEPNPDYVYLIGADKLSSSLHKISENVNKTYTNLELDYTYNEPNDINRFYYRSDHYNFAKKGIPVIFYFNGVHEDYHKETDTVDKIDFKKTVKITQLVFFTAWELANRDERLVVDSNKK